MALFQADRVTHTQAQVAKPHRWEWLAFVPHDAAPQRPSDPITLQATVVTVCLQCNSIPADRARRTAVDVGLGAQLWRVHVKPFLFFDYDYLI